MVVRSRIGISIQSRYGSTRLPGKATIDVAGTPLLLRVWNRVRGCRLVDDWVVTTSVASQPVIELCERAGIPHRTESEDDLLSRHLRVARDFDLDALVRVTGDNPLTDPEGIDALITMYMASDCNVVHNKHRAGYPFGTGAELVTRKTLEALDRRLESIEERATAFTRLLNDGLGFDVLTTPAPDGLARSEYFFTLDYEEDLALLRAIYDHFGGRDDQPLTDIIDFLDRNPELAGSNRHRHEGFGS